MNIHLPPNHHSGFKVSQRVIEVKTFSSNSKALKKIELFRS